jgi:hypothetical protein
MKYINSGTLLLSMVSYFYMYLFPSEFLILLIRNFRKLQNYRLNVIIIQA